MTSHRASAVAAATALALILVPLGASPAVAHQSPPGCQSNSLVLTPTKDKTLVRNGDATNYTVSVANDAGTACDLTGATVTLAVPAPDGTPTGPTTTLASGATYSAGAATAVLGTVPYVVAMNPGVSDAVAEARAGGILHDAPTDHAAQITKTLGTTVTQPAVTLTRTATPTSGTAPLTVGNTYTLTNNSSTNAPILNPSVTDERCAPVTYTGGDANGNGLLDVGETWTYTCRQVLRSGGVFTSVTTATGTNTVDNRPVPIAPADLRVTVTSPSRRSILGRRLPSATSRQARGNAACISVPTRLAVRARELTVVRVRVREGDDQAEGALVRITGPGFVERTTTNSGGSAVVRVRPTRSGTLVVQSDRCLGADRVRVLGARQVSRQAVPRLTG